jgi:excisionase family DNA binding protein
MADADTRSQRRRSAPVSGPGFASTADLVRRWRVSRNSVPVLADRLELLRSVVGGTPRWTWLSVWRAEGRLKPTEELWDELKQPLLTPPEVAELLQVSERTVRAWVARGELPAIHLSDQLRRIEPAAVAAIDDGAVRHLRRQIDGNGGNHARTRQREVKAPRLSVSPRPRANSSPSQETAQTRQNHLMPALPKRSPEEPRPDRTTPLFWLDDTKGHS